MNPSYLTLWIFWIIIINKTKSKDIRNAYALLPEVRLTLDKSTQINMEAGQQKRYYLTLHESKPLNFNFTSCSSPNQIIHKLFYNQTVNLFRGEKSAALFITIPCAPAGRYDLILLAKDKCSIWLIAEMRNPASNWSLIDRIGSTNFNYQNRIQKKQMILKWGKSKLDIHAVEYCLIINKEKNYRNLCSAIGDSNNVTSKTILKRISSGTIYSKHIKKTAKINPDRLTVVCTGKRNKQILKGLIPGNKYFIDIFGIHTMRNNLTFNLKSTSVWFNRSQPIELKDNLILMMKLPELGRQAVFYFKVPKMSSAPFVKFQILPCEKSVSVKVFILKKLIGNITIYKPTLMTFNASTEDRFIIKIGKGNKYENTNNRQIGISATLLDNFPEIPQLPLNTSVYQISSTSTCKSTWIAWHGSPDTRDIQYCVVLVKLGNKNKFFEDPFSSSFCEPISSVTHHPHFSQMHCFQSQSIDIEKFHVTNLTPDTFYAINVLVRLGRNSLFYNMIRVVTNKKCYDTIFDNTLNNHIRADV